MTTERSYTVGRIGHCGTSLPANDWPVPLAKTNKGIAPDFGGVWPEDYGKLVAANLAIARLRAALQRCIAPDGEAARLKHEALLES